MGGAGNLNDRVCTGPFGLSQIGSVFMRYETKQERRVRRRLNDYYGAHEVESIEMIDEDEYRAILIDGTVVHVIVLEDGTIDIQEIDPW